MPKLNLFSNNLRLLKLKNGIKVLIISDPSPINELKDNNQTGSCLPRLSCCRVDNDDDEEDEKLDSSNGCYTEKPAAGCLCVDVG